MTNNLLIRLSTFQYSSNQYDVLANSCLEAQIKKIIKKI